MSEHLYKTDTNAVLRFFETADKNNFWSERAGKPVFDTVLMAEVITPGQAASTLTVEIERTFNEAAGLNEDGSRKVRHTNHYTKFQKQVEAYKSDSGEYIDDGTPLKSWAQIDRGTAETFIAQGIHTVEGLASVSDGVLHNLGMGARTLREQAKAFLTARQFGMPTAQQAAEQVRLETRVAELEAENASLKEALAQAQAPESKPAKAGKPKVEADTNNLV